MNANTNEINIKLQKLTRIDIRNVLQRLVYETLPAKT
jgi:hypothetical protein